MQTQLELTGRSEAGIIKNLYPLYLHDISAFEGSKPNRHGVVGEADGVATLAEQCEAQDGWWQRPDALFPYLIRVDGRPAGFNLIATHPCLPSGIEADFAVHEFFVVQSYRGQGVAEQAALAGFELHRGTWEVVTYPAHARAIAFWRRVVRRHASGGFSESEGDHTWGRKIIFTFDNGR